MDKNLPLIKITFIILWITIKLILITALIDPYIAEFVYAGF